MIETETLLLRPIRLEDSIQVFDYRSDANTNKFQNFVPTDVSQVDEFIAENPSQFNVPNTWFQLVIIEKSSQKIIGDLGIHFIAGDHQQCELGCTLHKDFHGKGYATKAMALVIDYLFNTLNKHRIIASVDPENTASIQLLERLRFRKEAHFKQSLFFKGTWVDDVVYAVLQHEWNKD
ncbi:GNAT family protein [uncultured Kordia sp.]|uniref:GNAT family N-acetyltransferase n=1 Tax=uncultured Kordia sp. TaxID=507699 RepID=UPI0026063E03|nr:GNAT family protein [uncultured Kordia sp.]